jgi:hypothetical protein
VTAAAVVTIIGAAIAVLVLAAYLIYVAVTLRRVSARLGLIATGLALIPGKTAPIGPVLAKINHDLGAGDALLQTVLTKKRPPKRSAPPPPAPRAPVHNPSARNPAVPWVVAPGAARTSPVDRRST